jgi:lipopolysaccharide/colanic/teichoic acid biosynthesis glycosyltransferase
MLKRSFDIVFSLLGLILLVPLLLIIAFLIKSESKGPIFFRQSRVGENNVDFKIFKFRTMYVGSDKKGLLTVGDRDPRVTKVGFFLRKYKLDELPQLINVLLGHMSFVGPRPEVRHYVNYYSESDLNILSVKPGITDYASIHFRNEVELLKASKDPETYYIDVILPKKIALNKKYIENKNLLIDIRIILKTLLTIIN